MNISTIYRLGLLLILLLTGCQKPDAYDSHDNPIYLKDYTGKWLVVNYWAQWCQPCLKELPELNHLYLAHKDQLIVFGVSFDSLSGTEMRLFATQLQIAFPFLYSFPLQKFTSENVHTLPVTFLISPQGKLVHILRGPQTQKDVENILVANGI